MIDRSPEAKCLLAASHVQRAAAESKGIYLDDVLRRHFIAELPLFSFQPVGFVRSPYTDTRQIPKGPGAEHQAEGVLELLPQFEPGLTDIEGFSHLYVLWVFDRAVGFDLMSMPPTDDRVHGVFATRAPRRPNPIGLTVVQLLRRDGARLLVRGLDMLDDTPILDLKPYLTSVPPDQLKRGWLAEAEARRHAPSLGGNSLP